MRAFWSLSAHGNNFGDCLTPWVFGRLGLKLEYVDSKHVHIADLVACGSIGERIPEDYGGIILGTGFMYATTKRSWPLARILALRGDLTRQAAGAGDVPLGDFGLILHKFISRQEPKYTLGEIPHYTAYRDRLAMKTDDRLIINITAPVEVVLDLASKCERIISSSLHGLILADVLGIPNYWVPDCRVLGGGFKFMDYASAFGEKIQPYKWRLANRGRVDEIADYLYDCAKNIVKEAQ